LDDNILKTLGRSHTSHDAIESYYFARSAGFNNINFDLIFGVPGQDVNGWTETLDKVVNLVPEHISTYCLTLSNKNKYLQEVEEDFQADLFAVTRNQLSLHGYNHYEISNFSRIGFECRHNLLYWENQNYIGLGVAAHSHINNKRFHNCSSIKKYIDCIADGEIYSMDLDDLTENEVRKETVFLGLRLIKGVNNNQFISRFKYSVFELYPNEISSLQEKKLVVFSDGNLKLTEKGLMLANYAFMEFV
jgi:oxygen-independent coproporphyrinogen-3 oxidase